MEKLYVILASPRTGNVETIELVILKETGKTIKTTDGFLERTILRRMLPFAWHSTGLITNNVETGTAEWNRVKTEEIEDLKKELEEKESQLI